ncbi:MATE family efflux transporter [Cryobacterium sp. 10I1]|uniref:MATE family efflux transporter n=1 Tax=Cryobacterium sp. 10I1 TaxID=3048578 RepID=UPI002B2392E6|nr:MATE family efflux transporter [Cryobacterium sp. 10I1]MEB0306840.1 MATE family efflux transporter [Cryobacterium sp. 10I1]
MSASDARVGSIAIFRQRPIDREILRLALPAFGALVAEPLFLLADSAMVGHLGAVDLAGLGLASAVLQTIVGLMVFLAYSTTPAVARWLGAALSPQLVGAFGAEPAVAAASARYLTVSMLGLPAMLLVFAATGLLRGLQDTRTPLWVAGLGFTANIVLNLWFIYGLGLGLVGSALGTVVAQWAMVAVYLVVVVRHARREGARLRPHRGGMLRGASSGGWLFLRTVSLRAAMLLAVFVATSLGSPQLAAFQIAMTLFAAMAFALDALAIAAQALVGRGLGAGDLPGVRAVLRRCLEWGVLGGAAIGALLVVTSPLLGGLFTTAEEVSALLPLTLVVLGLSGPLCGLVFVLDGVLIGAEFGREGLHAYLRPQSVHRRIR